MAMKSYKHIIALILFTGIITTAANSKSDLDIFCEDKDNKKNSIYCKKYNYQDAKNIILQKYPGIFKNAQIISPQIKVVTFHSGVPGGIAENYEDLWQFNIYCKNGGRHAFIIVNADTGEMHPIIAPNSKKSSICKL